MNTQPQMIYKTGIQIIDAQFSEYGKHAQLVIRTDAAGNGDIYAVDNTKIWKKLPNGIMYPVAEGTKENGLQCLLRIVHCEPEYRMTEKEFWFYVMGWVAGQEDVGR